jgi:hypothetical protein
MSLDQLSLSSLHIEVWGDKYETSGEQLAMKMGDATGFLVEKNSQIYLVTNWHVVTGRDADTGQPLCKHGRLPKSLKVYFFKKLPAHEYDWDIVVFDLKEAKWIEHPRGQEIDVVAIPIAPGSGLQCTPINIDLMNTDVIPRPATPLSIIGFTCGLTGGGKFPIWVTGYMATEYTINIKNKPMFYVNASGREGLSGSPVILRTNGPYLDSKGNRIFTNELITKFLGIYSGRAHENSDVCRVFRAEILNELLV